MTEHALKLQRLHESSNFAPQDLQDVSKRQISTRLHAYGNYTVHLMLNFNLNPNLILPTRTASSVASAESMLPHSTLCLVMSFQACTSSWFFF